MKHGRITSYNPPVGSEMRVLDIENFREFYDSAGREGLNYTYGCLNDILRREGLSSIVRRCKKMLNYGGESLEEDASVFIVTNAGPEKVMKAVENATNALYWLLRPDDKKSGKPTPHIVVRKLSEYDIL